MQTQATKVGREFSFMNTSEREEWVMFKKLRGNRLYKLSHHQEALDAYMEALAGAVLLNDQVLVVLMLCNLSSCMLKLNKPRQAVELLDKALEHEPESVRALERKGVALMTIGENGDAMKVLIKANKLCKEPVIASQISAHLSKLQAHRKTEKTLYSKMLESNDSEPASEDYPFAYKMLIRGLRMLRSLSGVCKRK